MQSADLDRIFKYHAPKGDQSQRYEKIRAKAKELATVIVESCPDCADTTASIRSVRLAVMQANAAIAINE